ncbi:hypothetical protein RND71_003842 [Anisodus tanguticus]|uniref:Uncharacterized protein n=1 Tax=Anisodus tanguticus TaxID=243964 RepID=A0AAE1VUF4_9SOLA|nr:hypothetical protein RND71_003842 [Anisodus tanguticus]
MILAENEFQNNVLRAGRRFETDIGSLPGEAIQIKDETIAKEEKKKLKLVAVARIRVQRKIWSLIAGRLPGRTANDVKNYWNTHLQRKLISPRRQEGKYNNALKITENTILRPRPRTFSSATKPRCNNKSITNTIDKEERHNKEIVLNICGKPTGETTSYIDEGVQWWTSLLENCNEIEEAVGSFDEENKLPSSLHEKNSPPMQKGQSDALLDLVEGIRQLYIDFNEDEVWPIEVDLKFMEPIGRELKSVGKFMDSAVNLMNKSFIDR